MSTRDTRTEVKVGDYFNMTHSEKGNEVWDEQNRFETCQLIAIRPNGSWVYRPLWYEYSEADYPFTGSEITWSIPDSNSVLIERISDPEVEGFKDTYFTASKAEIAVVTPIIRLNIILRRW